MGEGLPHATTFLWEGMETYIDVHNANPVPAPTTASACSSRGLPPGLKRLTEDHGVCLSSCLDYWDDDLVLQAFSRCLILAPEIYGNPWLLRDDEFPRLARIYNLHRRYRDILVSGMLLPRGAVRPIRRQPRRRADAIHHPAEPLLEAGHHSGDARPTRSAWRKATVELRRVHPFERILGDYRWGADGRSRGASRSGPAS